MTFYGSVYRKFLFPILDRYVHGRDTLNYWRQAEQSQWLEPSKLLDKQFQDLRAIVEYANENCQYYRERWRSLGLSLESLNSFSDFQRWPILTRENARHNREGMQSQKTLHRLSKSTGGSTGEPLVFDLDAQSNQRRTAMTFRGYDWAGGGPGARRLLIWGDDIKSSSTFRKWKVRLHRAFDNELVLNCFDFSRDNMAKHFRTMMNFRPEVIIAYTNPLYEFSLYLREHSLVPIGIKSIIVGAEKIYPFQRSVIEEVFQSKVFETYGSREFMLIGAECDEHCGMHLSMENLFVEVVDDRGQTTPDGVEGNVVVTDLFNRAMPFVRYQNGDRAIAGFTNCRCGRGLPLLRQVVGRQLDVIRLSNGKIVPGEFFPHYFKDFPSIRRFQVQQLQPNQIEIRLVVEASFDESARQAINQQLKKTMGSEIELRLLQVDNIPLTKAGKLRVVFNQLSADQCQS